MERILDAIIPLASICLVFGIPIIAIMTHHQRKMAELMYGKHQDQSIDGTDINSLRYEVAMLREELQRQNAALTEVHSGIKGLQNSNGTAEGDVAMLRQSLEN